MKCEGTFLIWVDIKCTCNNIPPLLPSSLPLSAIVVPVFLGLPSIESLSANETAITPTWAVPNGSVVTDYVVTWERDTSMGCPYEDEGSINISTSALSYTTTITGLQEDSTYFITVTAVNSDMNSTSSVSTIETDEDSKCASLECAVPSHNSQY